VLGPSENSDGADVLAVLTVTDGADGTDDAKPKRCAIGLFHCGIDKTSALMR
jgi:hypothetical protein